jgi:precorrin-6B methylase 2
MLLLLYSIVLISVVVLRFKKPNIKRHMKAPFGKVGPIIISLFFLSLLIIWLTHTEGALLKLELALSLFILGIPLYSLIEMYYDPKAIRFAENILAYISLWTERMSLPIGVRKDLIRMMGNIKGKAILEFGCSVGTLTMHLAEEVGPRGKVFATSLSEKEIMITKKRADKRGHKHIIALHDTEHSTRIHPGIPTIHTVVSVGTLGYVQNIDNVLKDMNKRLNIGSKIFFVEYDKIFEIISNVAWLGNDKKIKKVFERNGFVVNVIRKQGFAWKYVYIYGVKVKDL